MALRLDEIICAHSGEDSFDEALKLLVAKLAAEVLEPADGADVFACPGPSDLKSAIDSLLQKAGAHWPGILAPDTTSRLATVELMRCAELLGPCRLLADDLVGLDAVFEVIVNKAAKGQKGQYFTPRHVITEVVEMVLPVPGERVLDPACGSGGFLRHALLREPRCEIYGFDQDPRAVRVAKVMLAASGASSERIKRADSLQRSCAGPSGGAAIEGAMRAALPSFAGFDVVLTNPPFAGDVGQAHAQDFELTRGARSERDVLFLERCVELLVPGGRLAIILPHNKVGSAPWAFMRRWLLSRVQVLAVLGLGRNTFRPHTSQKACVVIGVKRAQPLACLPDEEILFAISERDGKDSRGKLLLDAAGRDRIAHDLGELTPLVRARFALLEQRT